MAKFDSLSVFRSLAMNIEKLGLGNAGKEILQPKNSASFLVELTDGNDFHCSGDIRQVLNVPHGKMLKGLSLSGDGENEIALENGRRVVLGYMAAILASETTRRAFYTIACLSEALDENGYTLDDLLKWANVRPDNGILTQEVFDAWKVISAAIAEFDGYTSVRDIFSKASTTPTSIADAFKF